MPDNKALFQSGSFATDQISDVDYLVVKLAHGAADSATLVSTGSGLPVNLIAATAPKTIKRAVLNSSTDNASIIAAVAGRVLKVIGYAIQSTGTVNVELRDGSGGTPLTLLWNLQAREGAVSQVAEPPNFLFATTQAVGLNLGLSAAVTTGVEVSYFDDDAS